MSKTEIEVTHPQGAKKRFYKTSQVVRKGVNVTEYAIDSINGVFDKYTEWDIQMKNISAGYTYATFAGLCIIATTIIGILRFNQWPNFYAFIGLIFIIIGVVLVNLLGKN